MIHKSWNGELTPICCMSDTHLINTIKLFFKDFANNTALGFMIGKSIPKMTPEIFANIQVNKSPYLIEGLRRDNTRDKVLEILGEYNPVFTTKTVFENPNKLMLNSSKGNTSYEELYNLEDEF
jgi:hypothetical protein